MKDKEHGVYTEYSQDISKLINKNVHCMLCSSTSTPHKEQKDLEDVAIKQSNGIKELAYCKDENMHQSLKYTNRVQKATERSDQRS